MDIVGIGMLIVHVVCHRDGCYRDRPSRDATVGMSRGMR